jgi:HAD superfamily hydrolase (TIGR01509 family)
LRHAVFSNRIDMAADFGYYGVMITAMICDLDGLLVDTEKLHLQAYTEILAGRGVTLDPAEYARHWIRDGKGIADYVKKHGLSLDHRALHGEKTARYHELIRESLAPMPGALEFIERFRGRKRLALATSSYLEGVQMILDQLHITNVFKAVATRTSVARTKPAPDVFLYTAALLGAEASQCVVVEDAQKGVDAAHEAGMKSIAVPNRFTQNDDFSKATAIVGSLDDITTSFLDSMG